ncbi:unnamed protein product [Prunus armeniaca]
MIQDMVPYARRIGMLAYRRPYPGHFDQEEFSRGFKVSDFALFSRDGLQSTVEHIGQFTAQCAEIGHREALKPRIFPSTLTRQLSRGMSNFYKTPSQIGKSWSKSIDRSQKSQWPTCEDKPKAK